MDTNGLTKSEKKQKFQLVKEIYPFWSLRCNYVLDWWKINFHQQKQKNWEQNHKSNSDEIDERINQLEKKSKLSKILLLTLEIRKVI
jgi:hypothetical protein